MIMLEIYLSGVIITFLTCIIAIFFINKKGQKDNYVRDFIIGAVILSIISWFGLLYIIYLTTKP